MLKSFPILKKEWCTFDRKKGSLEKTKIVHFQGLSAFFNMQKYFKFVSSFEHVNFAINAKYSKKL
jgi:hypothetical protein